LPVVDSIAPDYADRVSFVAVAWKGTLAATAERAAELMPSGVIKWGLDAEEEIFAAYGVPYQPVTVLIGADKKVTDAWQGLREAADIRAALDTLVAGA
jgi:hypothetical protein